MFFLQLGRLGNLWLFKWLILYDGSRCTYLEWLVLHAFLTDISEVSPFGQDLAGFQWVLTPFLNLLFWCAVL